MTGVELLLARALERAVPNDTCRCCRATVWEEDTAADDGRDLPHAPGCPVADIERALARLREEQA